MGLSPAFLEPGFAGFDRPNGDRFELFAAHSPHNTFMPHPVVGFLARPLPFNPAEEGQRRLVCRMAATALYAAGARAYRIVSCHDGESFENSREVVGV
jgi:hypothetical protein